MIIILAPHLKFPTRNGGDIYIERLGCHLSTYRTPVYILGADTLTRYEMGGMTSQRDFPNSLRTKSWAGIRTLMFRSHYFIEKFLTKEYRQKAKELALEYPDALFVYSLISSASLELTAKPAIIITQNDEIAWLRTQSRSSNNLLQKVVSRISEDWLKSFLQNHVKRYFFAHITENDYQGYKHWLPGHNGFVVPAGVEISKLSGHVPWDGKIRLLFTGNLSVKMNYDALVFFQKNFWPVLKDSFKEKIELTVLGSQPIAGVRQLCQRENWRLLPDASEEELKTQYRHATFAILPFSYTSGAKLKLLGALAAGLPVLATLNMKILPGQDFSPNLYSDEPQEWLGHLQAFSATGLSHEQRSACQQYASQFCWDKVAADLDRNLRRVEALPDPMNKSLFTDFIPGIGKLLSVTTEVSIKNGAD